MRWGLLVVALCSSGGAAQTKGKAAEAKALVAEASRAYGAGRFAEAAELLEKARAIAPSGRVIYNLARAYERAGAVDKAVGLYEAYLERADAEQAVISKTRSALARLYKELARREAAEPPVDAPKATAQPEATPPAEPTPVAAAPVAEAPPPEPAPAPQTPPPTAAGAPPAAAVVSPVPLAEVTAPPPSRASPLVTVGAVLLGLGGAGLGTGVGFGISAQHAAGQMRASTDPMLKPMLRETALWQASVADWTLLGGAVVATAGLILLLIGLRA